MRKKVFSFIVLTLFIISVLLPIAETTRLSVKSNQYGKGFIKIIENPSLIPEHTNPVFVEITYPPNGAEIPGSSVEILGFATDDAGLNYWEWTWEWDGGSYSNSSYFDIANHVEFSIQLNGLPAGLNVVTVTFFNIMEDSGFDLVEFFHYSEDPPEVTIEIPEDGTTVYNPQITLYGLATDDGGIVSLGSHHEWEWDETITSGTVDPPQTYFPFEWEFDLYEGWNKITIFAEDEGGLYGEDSVEIYYYPEIPEITFYQLNIKMDDIFVKDSSWGQAILPYDDLAEIIYVNLEVNDNWVVRNLPIMPVSDEIVLDFPLDVSNGVDVVSLEFAYDISLEPLSNYNPIEIQVAPVLDGNVDMDSGEADEVAIYNSLDVNFIGWLPIDFAYHEKNNITNQDCNKAECVPAAISNSLRFLKKKHKMTSKKMEDANTSIDKMKPATGWHAGGAPFGWWDKKKKYMEDNGYPITTTIHNSDVDLDDIIKEMKKGQDIELRVPGHAAMIVGIIKHANGKYTVSVAHDTNQTNPNDGTQTQHTTYDPTTGKFTGGTWINGRKLSKIVVECPKKENKPPDKPAKPDGPGSGKKNNAYSYDSGTTDPDNDQVSYTFDWGDGTTSGLLGPYPSGSTVTATHTWTSQGTFDIRVKAVDTHGAESNWSDSLSVSMPRPRTPIISLLYKLFDQNQIIGNFLRRILNIY